MGFIGFIGLMGRQSVPVPFKIFSAIPINIIPGSSAGPYISNTAPLSAEVT
jgi:hypothetical protein